MGGSPFGRSQIFAGTNTTHQAPLHSWCVCRTKSLGSSFEDWRRKLRQSCTRKTRPYASTRSGFYGYFVVPHRRPPTSRRALPWLIATLVLGSLFLTGQMLAWHQLALLGTPFKSSRDRKSTRLNS